MKNNFFKTVAIVAIVLGLVAAGSVSVVGIGKSVSYAQSIYEQGGADTVKWSREKGVVGLSFGILSDDTINVGSVIVKRVIDNKIVTIPAVASADTIGADDSSATQASFVYAVTMTPYADEYWVVVNYKTGVTYKNGSGANDSTFIAKYGFRKQYSAD